MASKAPTQYAVHLLPQMKDVAAMVEADTISAGMMNRLMRLAMSIHTTEGASPQLKRCANLIDEYVHARKNYFREELPRPAKQVMVELRPTVQTFAGNKEAYKISPEPDFKARAKKLEHNAGAGYEELEKAYAGSKYAGVLAKQKAAATKVHGESIEERAKLESDHKAHAALHRKYAKMASTPEKQRAHDRVASFHESAARLQRSAAVHAAGNKADPNRPTVVGKRGGRYIVLQGGGKWYIGKGG